MPEPCSVGVDIGGTKIRTGLVGSTGAVLFVREHPTEPQRPAQQIEASVRELIAACLQAARDRHLAPCGIGIAMPGFLDEHQERVAYAINLPTLNGYPLVRRIQEAFDLPVRFEADCHAAALAEHRFGAGVGSRRLIVAMVGTGIGASVVIDGEVLRISQGGAGMLGHIVLDADGPRCACGARGCLEALASVRALEAAANKLADAAPQASLGRLREHGGRLGLDQFAEALAQGHREAHELLDGCARWLATGFATWAVIFAPDRIVIGGGMARLGAPLLAAIRQHLDRVGQPRTCGRITLRLAGLGADAGLIGAAMVART